MTSATCRPQLGNQAAEHKAGEDAGAMIAEAGLAALWLAAALSLLQLLLALGDLRGWLDGATARSARDRGRRRAC